MTQNCKSRFQTQPHYLKAKKNVSLLIFEFKHFPPYLMLSKLPYLVTLSDYNLQFFKNSHKLIILAIFMSTKLVNIARFPRNVE